MRIGIDDWPPYEFPLRDPKSGEEKILGFSCEIVFHVLQRMGVYRYEVGVFPWSRVENNLSQGELDAAFSVSYSKKRASYAHFPTESLIDSPWVFFVHKDEEAKWKIQTWDELRGARIGVVKDYSYTPEFWQFLKGKAQGEMVKHDSLNFRKLARKRLDLVVSELRNGLALIKKLGLQDQIVPMRGPPVKVTGLYVIFSRKTVDAEFVRRFSEELKKFKEGPEYQRIFLNYL